MGLTWLIDSNMKKLTAVLMMFVMVGATTNAIMVNAQEDFLTYENPTHGIRTMYPTDWQLVEEGLPSNSIVAFDSPQESKFDLVIENVVIVIENVGPNVAVEEYIEEQIESVRDFYSDVSIVESTETTLSGNPAHKTVFTGSREDSLFVDKVMLVAMIKDLDAYMLVYNADDEAYDNYLESVQKMIDSFEIGAKSVSETPVGEEEEQENGEGITPMLVMITDSRSTAVEVSIDRGIIQGNKVKVDPPQQVEFHIIFRDLETLRVLEDVNYIITIVDETGNQLIHESNRVPEGMASHSVSFTDTGSFTLTINVEGTGINEPYDTTYSGTASTTVTVTPEFPLGVIAVLAAIVGIGIAVSRLKSSTHNLFPGASSLWSFSVLDAITYHHLQLSIMRIKSGNYVQI